MTAPRESGGAGDRPSSAGFCVICLAGTLGRPAPAELIDTDMGKLCPSCIEVRAEIRRANMRRRATEGGGAS